MLGGNTNNAFAEEEEQKSLVRNQRPTTSHQIIVEKRRLQNFYNLNGSANNLIKNGTQIMGASSL